MALLPLCQDRIWIWKCWFLRRGENRSTRRKTSRSKDENQQQTQPTYDAESGNRTRATLVGGERSHHCAIPAPQDIYIAYTEEGGTLCPPGRLGINCHYFKSNIFPIDLFIERNREVGGRLRWWGGGGGRCCDKFQIFQISINVSPEPLKVVKTANLVLLMWMDAKEDYEGKTFFPGSLHAGWDMWPRENIPCQSPLQTV